MPGHKKAIQSDTLTFVNEEITFNEVIGMFQMYGALKYVNRYMNRFFVQFETVKQAKKARFHLGRIYRVAFAHAKPKPQLRNNFRPEGQQFRFSNSEDFPRFGDTASRNTPSGMAMIEEYLNAARRQASSASTRNEMARSNENLRERERQLENRRGKTKRSRNGREMARGSENRRGMAKSSKNQPQMKAKQNQRGKPANPKPNSAPVRDPEYADSDDFDDDIEEPEAPKRTGEESEAEEYEYEYEEEEEEEEEDEDDEDDDNDDDDQDETEEEEEDEQAEARALGAGTRRRVRIRALDEAKQELGHDMAYSVIMANIPQRYTLDEVYDLVEEVRPLAFSEMDYSLKMRVKFCEIFVNDAADVDYLKQKLNDFVICGKQLTVMEPAEIMDETRWTA